MTILFPLHQCRRSREEQSTHLILKAQVVGEGKKKPFWSACSMAVGNHCRDGIWCILFDGSEAVLPLWVCYRKPLGGSLHTRGKCGLAWKHWEVGLRYAVETVFLKQPNNQNMWAPFTLTLQYDIIFMGSCSRMLSFSRSHRAVVFCSLVCESVTETVTVVRR